MLQLWPPIAKFFQQLFRLDQQMLAEAQRRGCPFCGGRLDRGDYGRKARGLPAGIEPLFDKRFSLCCAREGCRKRTTPASVRFFGRRVYAGALFVLASAVWVLGAVGGRSLLGVPRRTLERWHGFWQMEFLKNQLWLEVRGLMLPPPEASLLPASLLTGFARGDPDSHALLQTLQLLRPLTTSAPSFSRVDFGR